MKKTRTFAIFFSVLILISSIFPSMMAEESEPETDSAPNKLFDKIAILFFRSTVGIMGIPWNVLRFTEPESFTPDKDFVEIGYQESESVTIGIINETSGKYKSLMDFESYPIFLGYDYVFTVEMPDYLPEGAFKTTFSKQRLDLFKEGEVKTVLTVYSNIKPDISLPENIVIRVNISKYVTAGNLYFPPKGERGFFPFNLITGKRNTILWFLSSIGVTSPIPFGKIYSGVRDLDYSTHVDIIVRPKRTHIISINPQQNSIELDPDSVYSIPVEVKNLGSHIDSFNFNVGTDKNDELLISAPQSITLKPNEVGIVNLGIATSERFWDPGTLHSIKIEGYSIYEPDSVYNNTIPVITKGVYVSEFNGVILLIGIIVLVIVIYAIYTFIKHKQKLTVKKPYKPLFRGVNKKIENIKKTVKGKQIKEEKPKEKIVKAPPKTKKEKPKKEVPKKEVKEEKPINTEKEVEIKKAKLRNREKEIERLKKNQVIEKIKKQQEKQKRRVG